MTRDQWLEKCAAKLRDDGGMEPGEAAAYAIRLSEAQQHDWGRNPAHWLKPERVASEEITGWED